VERNLPDVVGEVAACFAAYERALVERDLEAMARFFDDSDVVVRYGIAERQHGSAELAAFRASQAAPPPGRTLTETVITTFGREFAVVATLFTYPGRSFLGRQSQTWARLAPGWRIVHAHVSEIPLVE
jgi:hypothetical protein